MTAVVVLLVVLAAGAAVRAVVLTRAEGSVQRRLAATGASDPKVSARPSPRAAIVLGLAVAGGLVVAGVIGAALAGSVAIVASRAVSRRRVAARARAEVDGLADVVDAVGRALRAGVPPLAAVRIGAASAPPEVAAGLHRAATTAERGVPLAEAIDRWADADRATGGGASLVAAAFAVHATAGGDPARSLAGVADTLRERRALRREVRALASQARLSAAVIAVAPAGFAALAVATDERTAAFLLRTPAGAGCLAVGGALELAGWRWMDRITRSVA